MKKIIILLLILFSTKTVYANDDFDTKLKTFLQNYPTIFYTEDQKLGLIPIQRYADEVEFIDIDSDNNPEVIIIYKIMEGKTADIYKFLDGEFIKIGTIEGFYKFYKNKNNKTTLFEGNDFYSPGIRYSYVYFEQDKFFKDIIYCDTNIRYNRYSDNFYNKEELLKNNKLLDNTIKRIEPVSIPTAYNYVKDIVRKNNDITLILNDIKIKTDTNPIIKDNRILVPVRTIAENFKKEISFDQNTRTVLIKDSNNELKLKIGDKKAYKNGKLLELPTEPIINNNYTMLPIRTIIEELGGSIYWVDKTKTALIQFADIYRFTPDLENVIQVCDYDETIAKEFTKVYSFTEIENADKLMLWSNDNITDIKIYALSPDIVPEKEMIYKLDKLNLGEVLIYETRVPEGMPSSKITYRDSMNNLRSIVLSYNGRFGGTHVSHYLGSE